MDPIRFAIRNPVTISVGVILTILFGLLSLRAIPVQLTPNVDQPVVAVTTRWEGAGPEEIEADIIIPQEERLSSVSGLEKMTSTSQQGEGQILLEFPVGTDKDAAFNEVSEKLRQVPDYPDNVDEPVVEKSDPRNRDYIAWTILYCSDPDFDVATLKKFAEDRIKTALERVPGVSEVPVYGGTEPEVHVAVDPIHLAQQRIPPTRLALKLRQQNLNASAGALVEGKYDVTLRATGRFERLDQIEQLVISEPGEPVVRVRDVADVKHSYKEPFAIVRSKGSRVLAIPVQREVGTNVMEVMAGVKRVINEQINPHILPNEARRLGINGKLVLQQVYDQTIYIDDAIALVRSNLFVGGSLAVIVLLLFLRGYLGLIFIIPGAVVAYFVGGLWGFAILGAAIACLLLLRGCRSALIVAMAIPISVIGTFVAMVAMGRNINVISLAGLAFAVGLVVDNAIVVLENIDRHRKLGESAAAAAYRATKEVWGAILASTATTLAVFLPVLTIQEEAGQLFLDISLAVCAAVTFSLLVSVLVIPTAAARFLREKEKKGQAPTPAAPARPSAASRLVNAVAELVYWLTRTWVIRPLIIVSFVVVSLVFSWLLMPPSSYLPTGNRNIVFAMMFPPPGYHVEYQESIGIRMEEQTVRQYWEARPGEPSAEALPDVTVLDYATMTTRTTKPPPIDNFFFVGLEFGLMFMGATSTDPDRVAPIADLLQFTMGQQPGIRGFPFQLPLFETGGGIGSGIELEISGPNLNEVVQAANQLFPMTTQRFGQVAPDPGNYDQARPEVRVILDPVKASDLDMSAEDVALYVRMLGDGQILGDFYQGGDTIDLKLIADRADDADAMSVRDAPIAATSGQIVPLGSVTKVLRTPAPQQINRIEEQRSVTLQINVAEDIALESAMDMVQNEMIQPLRDRGLIPPTVETNLAGTAAKLQEVKRALMGTWTGFNVDSLWSLFTSRAFLALLVVFLLMAALFEGWLYPLVILFSVPMATVGGFLALRLVYIYTAADFNLPTQQLDVLTMLGFVILIGVVVNNAILLVHQALNFMRGVAETQVEGQIVEKMAPREAIREAVRTRFRPIFMSMFTSVGGMLPLVLFPGSGSELYRGLGSVVVGGLIVSTVFTLILVPLVLSLVFDLRRLLPGGESADVGLTEVLTSESESKSSI